MFVRRLTTRSLLLAAAAANALPLLAQDTPRRPADSRISISKGEVALPPRVDTVYVTRYDTVRVTNTVRRIDTVVVAQPVPVPIPHTLNDWFWSLYAGASAPLSEISDLYTTGYHFGVAGGWDPRDSWFGAQLSLTYSQFGREVGFPIFRNLFIDPIFLDRDLDGGTPSTWQLGLDLKAKWPTGGWSPYLLGGLGFNSYRNLATVEDLGDREVFFDVDDDIVRLEDESFCRLDRGNSAIRLLTNFNRAFGLLNP